MKKWIKKTKKNYFSRYLMPVKLNRYSLYVREYNVYNDWTMDKYIHKLI